MWKKNLTKKQINNYKITEREFYEKFSDLSEDKLNAMSNKNVYIQNDVITAIIEHCRGEKKKYLKNILLRFLKLILIFMKITKKKYKLTKMVTNTYYLELIFILINIF